MVQLALRRNNGKITLAAADLGISRPTLYELMDKLGLRRESGRQEVQEPPEGPANG
jgi:two-component system NtrC family response regulator